MEHRGERREEGWQKGKNYGQSKNKNMAPLLQLQEGTNLPPRRKLPNGRKNHASACFLHQGDISGDAVHCPLKMGALQRSGGQLQQTDAGRSHLCARHLLFLMSFLLSPLRALLPKLWSPERYHQHHLRIY